MTGRRLALFGIAALPLIAAGCATPGAPSAPLPAGAGASRWAGRFAVTMIDAGAEPREERTSGRFVLESLPGATLLELRSPFGQTVATASLQAGRAELLTAEGRRFEADSAEALTEQVLGWPMPVGDLPRWLRGRLERPTESSDGRPVAGNEHGWAIRFEDWGSHGPVRLSLAWPDRPAAVDRKVRLKLIVDDVS